MCDKQISEAIAFVFKAFDLSVLITPLLSLLMQNERHK